jgi:Ca2+-binding RTX toxin-like protein
MLTISNIANEPNVAGDVHILDVFNGTDGADQLFGGDDGDTMTGLGGSDILYGFGGADSIDGGAGSDFLNGGLGDDQELGGAGADFLKGGAGDDTLDGGHGIDRAGFLGAAGPVHVDLRIQGVAQDTGEGMDTLISIENLSGTAGDDTLIGDDGDNVITGSGGSDKLSGYGGDDLFSAISGGVNTINGGSGVDTVQFDSNGADSIVSTHVDLSVSGPQDTGAGTVTFVQIENLSGSMNEESSDHFFGSKADNILAGADADDELHGAAGNDLLLGDGSIFGDFGAAGYSGAQTVVQEGFGAGADTLDGGVGVDSLVGGAGGDQLTGGAGPDAFIFLDITDSNTAGGVDLITDLTGKDTIDLSAIDADTTIDGDQAFHLVKTFSGQAGELVRSYNAQANETHFLMDVNGDGTADMDIAVTGNLHAFTGFAL